MSLKQRLEADIKSALKRGDKLRLTCLRMLKSKLQEQELARRSRPESEREMSDDDVMSVVAAYAKQRRDSIESYRQGARDDLVAREEAELAIVSEYLPKQLSDEELRSIVSEAIAECGASSVKDLGAVMKAAIPKVQGAADGKRVNQIARNLLQSG